MVFQGLNIFSKQNQEGVCPPHIYPLSVAKPLLLKEIWITLGKLKTGTENALK